MKIIKLSSVLLAVFFVALSSFTTRFTSNIFEFDDANFSYTSESDIKSYQSYKAVPSACPSNDDPYVCTVLISGDFQDLGDPPANSFSQGLQDELWRIQSTTDHAVSATYLGVVKLKSMP